jgi:TonB-linked SusC/RagA family outer membrane protein
VDGVPITNTQNQSGSALNAQVDFGSGINAFNPDNIENMTVLKGAAATALYGSRAANGVIMITTKSGKNTEGKVKVAYDGNVTLTQVGRLPNEQKLFGQGWSGDRALDENGNWGAPFDGKDRVWGNVVDNSQKIKPYLYLNNRIRDFFDIGVGYKNALSFSGGSEATQYHLALSQNKVDGAIPTDHDSYKRYTMAATGSHKGKKLTLSSSINVSSETTNSVPTGQGASLYRSLNEIGTDVSIVDLKNYKNDKFNTLDNYFTPYGTNPYWVLNENGATQERYKFFGKFQADYDILKNLKVTYRFGGDYETTKSETHVAVVKYTEGSLQDLHPANPAGDVGNYEQIRRQRLQLNHDIFATYNDKFGDFSLNAILGWNVNERSADRITGIANSIDVEGFYHFSNTLSTPVASQLSDQRRLVGGYISADLGFRDYAYLTLTARNDWSSTLPKENNSFFYPGATFSFLLTDFLQKQLNISANNVVDFAKLRVAYGQTGNDADPYYVYNRYVAGYVTTPGYPSVDNITFPIGGANSYRVSTQLGNLDLKPELTTEFELGAEVNFFGNRIGLEVSYYNRFTKGLLELLPSDPSTGYLNRMANLGDVSNKGVEIGLTLVPVKTADFTWSLSGNFSKNYNMVENLEGVDEIFIDGYGGLGIYAVKGQPMGQFKSQMAQKVHFNGVESTVVDGNGNPVPTPDEQFLNKDVNEKFRAGASTVISWKGLSLSATFDLRYGGYMFSYTKDYMNWVGSDPFSVMNNRYPFLIPNSVVQNADGTYSENSTPVDPTALHTFYSNGGLQYNDANVIDRSYLKLRDLSLSYDLPRSICQKIRLEGLRVSVNAGNFLLWTPQENQYIDPETTTFGNDVGAKFGEFGVNPSYHIYTFGLSFTF